MSRRFSIAIGVLVCCFAAVTVLADDLTIPNTFQPNTPARAAEVNENFTAVEASVDDNAADIATNAGEIANIAIAAQTNSAAITRNSVIVTANGQSLGVLLQIQPISIYRTISATGYVFDVPATANFDTSERGIDILRPIAAVLYETSDCSGPGYWATSDSAPEVTQIGQFIAVQGLVFRGGPAIVNPGDPIPLRFYVPRGSEPQVRTFFSYSGNNQMNYMCQLVADPSGDTVPSVPVLLNDPVVTGVPNSLIETPVLLGVP